MKAVADWFSVFTDVTHSERGKIATIWFDEIILHTPRPDLIRRYINSLQERFRFENKIAWELNEIWKPPHIYMDDYQFGAKNYWNINSDLTAAVYEAMQINFRRSTPELANSYEEHREIGLGGAGFLEFIDIYSTLCQHDSCSMLLNPDSEAIIKTLLEQLPEFRAEVGAVENTFQAIVEIAVPNLSDLPWEAVIELRHHRYFENFRAIVRLLHERAGDLSRAELRDLLGELKLAEMERVVRSERPAVGKATLTAVLGNLPGLPINPISIAAGAADIWKNHVRKTQSGWLYFLFDLEEAGSKGT